MINLLGNILQELLQREGSPSVKDFAKMMGMSTRTVYNIYDGSSSMTFDQVVKASEILNYDMAAEYYERSGKGKNSQFSEPQSGYKQAKNIISVTLTLSGAISAYDNFSQLLNKLRNEVKDFGFEIG